MNKGFCIVITTFSSEKEAEAVIEKVIREKLAACVQSMPITSTYYWDGDVQKDNEVLVLFKTKESLYCEIKRTILEEHKYETPELVRVNIDDGYEDYLSWINEVTRHE